MDVNDTQGNGPDQRPTVEGRRRKPTRGGADRRRGRSGDARAATA